MNARDPQLPLQADEASALGEFAARVWDEETVPALTQYIAIPAKSPMFDADWAENGQYREGAARRRHLGREQEGGRPSSWKCCACPAARR